MTHALRMPALATALLALSLVACGHSSRANPDAGDGGLSDAGDGGDSGTPDAGLTDGGDAGVAVVVSEVFPAQGPVAGGTSVLVSGSGFVQGFATTGGGAVSAQTRLTVGGAAATAINVIDDNRLQASTPAGNAGTADVIVTNPNGSGTCAGCFRYLAHVEVDAIDPASGPSRGGTAVTIHGQGFTDDLQITIGGAPLVTLTIVDGATATGFTPPGALGPAEVDAITHDGRGTAPGAFTYRDALSLTDVQPRLSGTAGGTALTLTGSGFSSAATVAIDGTPASSYWIDPSHLGAVAIPHAAGPTDVTVTDPTALLADGGTASATLHRGLVYGDLAATLPGPLLLESIWPSHGPLAGGVCPSACMHLEGSGFSAPDLAVTIGGAVVPPGTVHVTSDQELSLDLPPGAQAGAVDVAVSSASESATSTIPASDPGAFHYDPALSISGVTPSSGPATGAPAVAVTILGVGFDQSAGAPLEVRIGALDALNVQVAPDGRSLTAVAPAGPGGPADVQVIATDLDGTQRSATLPAGFTFTAPLSLLQISPSSGSQAGGETVTLYGSGFASGLAVSFGAASASLIQILSSTEATCLIPAGSPGAVDVSVALGAGMDLLHHGFTYYDPTSNAGGTAGAILQGTLNVTVLDEINGGGLARAEVDVTLSDGSTLNALTDNNGQVTFSDPRLVLSVSVTASKETYSSFTATDVAVEDLTLLLIGPSTTPPPPPSDAGPPPPPESASISGHVYGFKIPPTLVLGANQRVVAYVRLTPTSIYAAAPFSSPGTPLIVTTDGGSYSFLTYDLAPFGLYAELGVETTTSPGVTSFAPFLLGVLRAVQPDPNTPVTNADIILDTHLDETVTATLTSPPDPGPGNTLLHQAAVDLDLGSGGIVPLDSAQSTGSSLDFTPLPSAEGQGFVFIDEVTNGSAESVYLRRIFGDVSQGVTLGPYLPFPNLLAPLNGGAPFTGTFSWSYADGEQPNLQQLRIDSALASGADVSWTVVLPGTARSVALPEAVSLQLPSGSTVAWTLTASYAPGFNFDFWIYSDLGGTGWIAYAYGFNQYTVP